MNGIDLTAAVMGAIGLVSSYFVPKALNRKQARKEEEADTDLSWVSINKAIVAERNKLQADLESLKATHAGELAALRKQHGEEVKALSDRLTECQGRVGNLYDELRRRPQ